MIPASYYHDLRAPYTPEPVRLVLLFESPPVSGKYFYDPDGSVNETLFSAIMKLFGWTPETKHEGLEQLRTTGVVLLDATYQQINAEDLTRTQRRDIMRAEVPKLLERLPEEVPVIIGMTAVLDAVGAQVAEHRLLLNQGVRIPFPAMGNQHKFHERASQVLMDRRPL